MPSPLMSMLRRDSKSENIQDMAHLCLTYPHCDGCRRRPAGSALSNCLLGVLQHLGEGSACTRCRADEACMDMSALWDRYTLGTGEG